MDLTICICDQIKKNIFKVLFQSRAIRESTKCSCEFLMGGLL